MPAGSAYRFVIEGRPEGLADEGGLAWSIRDRAGKRLTEMVVHPSEDWTDRKAHLPAEMQDRVLDVVLTYQRPSGSVRAQGTARFRLAALEQVPG